MKMYKKEDLTLMNGRLVTEDGTVIAISPDVPDQINDLETRYQKSIWSKNQPVACEGPNFDEFKRVSMKNVEKYKFSVDTPNLDKMVEESMAIMKEMDVQNITDEINKRIEEFGDLLRWCDDDNVLCNEHGLILEIDAPFLTKDYGSILDWSAQTVSDIIVKIYETALNAEYCSDLNITPEYNEDVESE